jgi:hypothetical protein
MRNRVHFVRFNQPLATIIGVLAGDDEMQRQQAVEKLRDRILLAAKDDKQDEMRIIVRSQKELWDSGVRAGRALAKSTNDEDETSDDFDDHPFSADPGQYVAGKWGRFVRAPDFYFEVMRDFGDRFAPLGEIAALRRGITSGCDDFFMPRDITAQALDECTNDLQFRTRFGLDRKPAASGKIKIIEAGDGSVHPIEAEYLAPEVHSLMKVDRPVVRASSLDRVVLLVGKPLSELTGTWVAKYLRYGQTRAFASSKSKPVPVPKRSTCAARDPWYDLTGLVDPGFAFWPKSQQYRHIVPANPEQLICNCNLYDLAAPDLSKAEHTALVAILNSTLVGLFKTFYGRFAGTEGNLKTEVVDVNLLEVPNPRNLNKEVRDKLADALKGMMKRDIGRLVEEQLMDCHSPERARLIAEGPLVLSDELQQNDRRQLDDAVFELLGVASARRRGILVDRLHQETASHFRDIRVVEIQKMEQRATSATKKFRADELAADAWDAFQGEKDVSLLQWLGKNVKDGSDFEIPAQSPPRLAESSHMFDSQIVYFGKGKDVAVEFDTREQADLVYLLAMSGVHGPIPMPTDEADVLRIRKLLEKRLSDAIEAFRTLASSRTNNEAVQTEVVDLLMHWFAVGRNG